MVRGVGCDDEGLNDDDDNDGEDDKTPDFGASLDANMTAGVRRPRAAAFDVIVLSLSGV